MTAVAAILAAAAIAAPGATASQPPAGINTGLGPSSGQAAIADADQAGSTVPAGPNPVLGPSSGRLAVAAASTDSRHAATPTASAGGFSWGDASIGAAAMVMLLGLGAASLVLIRRSGRAGQPVG